MKDLLTFHVLVVKAGVKPEDIAIITPYNAQVCQTSFFVVQVYRQTGSRPKHIGGKSSTETSGSSFQASCL